jgi:hypothetical protein
MNTAFLIATTIVFGIAIWVSISAASRIFYVSLNKRDLDETYSIAATALAWTVFYLLTHLH